MLSNVEEQEVIDVDNLTEEETDSLLESYLGSDIGDESFTEDSEEVITTEEDETTTEDSEEDTGTEEVDETAEEQEEEEEVTTEEEVDESETVTEEDPTKVFKDSLYEVLVEKGFKANGTIRRVRDAEHAKSLIQQGFGANETIRKLKPYARQLKSLENAGVTLDDNTLGFIVELMNGSEDAIKELIFKKHNIGEDKIESWLDSRDTDDKTYVPNNYSIDDSVLAVQENLDSVSGSEYYPKLSGFLSSIDDVGSSRIREHPELISYLHNDMESGVYDKVMDEALYRMDRGILPKQSILNAYIAVMQDEKFTAELYNNNTEAEKITKKEVSETKKKVITRKKKASSVGTSNSRSNNNTPKNGKINVDKLSESELDDILSQFLED